MQDQKLKPDTALKRQHSLHNDEVIDRSLSDCYSFFDGIGMTYGKSFQLLQDIYVNSEFAKASLHMDGPVPGESRYFIHPTVLDSALQLCIITTRVSRREAVTSPFVPFSFRKLVAVQRHTGRVSIKDVAELSSVASTSQYVLRGLRGQVDIQDGENPLISIRDLVLLAIEGETVPKAQGTEQFTRLVWVPDI